MKSKFPLLTVTSLALASFPISASAAILHTFATGGGVTGPATPVGGQFPGITFTSQSTVARSRIHRRSSPSAEITYALPLESSRLTGWLWNWQERVCERPSR